MKLDDDEYSLLTMKGGLVNHIIAGCHQKALNWPTIPDSQGQVSSNTKYVYGFFYYEVVIVMNSSIPLTPRAYLSVQDPYCLDDVSLNTYSTSITGC